MTQNRRPPAVAVLSRFGTAGVYRPIDGLPVSTTAILERGAPAPAVGALGMGGDVALRDLLWLPRNAAPTEPPIGSTFEADFDDGAGVRVVRVDRIDHQDPDFWPVVVS